MKTIFYAFLLGCIPAGMIAHVAYGQNSNVASVISHPKVFETSVETLYASPKTTAEVTALKSINAKAIKNFNNTYKEATDVQWSVAPKGFMARFIAGGIVNRTFYNKNGRWNFTILYYDEKNLPREVRSIVKKVYYDYTIKGVQEIRIEDKIVYLVEVEDEKGSRTLRVCDGEMETYQEFTK